MSRRAAGVARGESAAKSALPPVSGNNAAAGSGGGGPDLFAHPPHPHPARLVRTRRLNASVHEEGACLRRVPHDEGACMRLVRRVNASMHEEGEREHA